MSTWIIKKNVLDLEHTESMARAVTLLAIGLGGFPTLLFGLNMKGITTIVAIMITLFFSFLFIFSALQSFNQCREIRDKIRALGTDNQKTQSL